MATTQDTTPLLDVIALPGLVERLRATPPPATGVLSVYLDTSPARAAGQGYLLAYRDQCKATRPLLPDGEGKAFEAAARRAEAFLTDAEVAGRAGVALFVGEPPDYVYAAALPAPPLERLRWGSHPDIEPLQVLLDDYERVAVLLLDAERARLFTVYLGTIASAQTFEDYVPPKQKGGGWFALAQSRAARHREDHVLRHVKRVTAALMTMLRQQPFDRLYLAGPAEPLAVLRHHLPRPLRARLAGTLSLELFAPDAEVLQVTLAAAERTEREAEAAAVTELIEAAPTPRVALGLGATLTALNEGRVHVLFLADTWTAVGGECAACAALVPGVGHCPTCGAPTEPVAELRGRVVERALDQGAKLEFVSAGAAALLAVHGGIGAWTRY
jgi:peptide subunit release factor 1 (eRF1)